MYREVTMIEFREVLRLYVLLALHPSGGRPRGEDWTRCSEQREIIQHWLAQGARLTKIRKLLARQGVSIGYPTLYRFAVEQLQFGRAATTIPILEGEPANSFFRVRCRLHLPPLVQSRRMERTASTGCFAQERLDFRVKIAGDS